MSIKTMSTLPFRPNKVKVYFLRIISLSIYIPHKNIFNLYVSYFPDMYFLYHIFSNSLNKISKMCWVFTFKIKVRDKVFVWYPVNQNNVNPAIHNHQSQGLVFMDHISINIYPHKNISNFHIILYFSPRYLLYRVVTTNFPPLFYIIVAQKETLKNAMER